MKVPFLDLKRPYETLRPEILPAIEAVLSSAAFAGGPFVARFEEEFAAYCGRRFAVGVGNGTDALWLALLALGVGPGDEVITAANTFIATAEAISFTGAKPVFVDVEETTYNMNPSLVEAAITPRTRVIIPVHLYGQMADMDPILAVAQRHGLQVVEDASQAHGAKYNGRPAGSMGGMGCFSFYPGKNLGAYGEGGAVVTDDEKLAGQLRALREHGQKQKYIHQVIGWNARMDGIQGAVLSVKLRYLDEGNDARRRHARDYDRLLAGLPAVVRPVERPGSHHVYHIYAVRVPDRDRVLREMDQRGVSCGIHYPVPIHLQEAYAALKLSRGAYPVAERCAGEELSLPMYPELTEEMVGYVAGQLREVLVETAQPVTR